MLDRGLETDMNINQCIQINLPPETWFPNIVSKLLNAQQSEGFQYLNLILDHGRLKEVTCVSYSQA